jgi:hypothetical protein
MTFVRIQTAAELAAEAHAARLSTYQNAVQDHIDTTAKSKGYNDAASLAGYTVSTIPVWQSEAAAFVAWRDQVWIFVFDTLAQIQAGNLAPPESPEALITQLPAITWP